MMPVYIHRIYSGSGPKLAPTTCLYKKSICLTFLIFWVAWFVQVSLLSRVTPRYLAESFHSNSILLSCRLLHFHFSFFVKTTATDLLALNLRPWLFPQVETWSSACCVLLMSESRTGPPAMSTRSSAYPFALTGPWSKSDNTPSKARFHKTGDSTPPCGVPLTRFRLDVTP